jgi:hypothetical protein
VSKARDAENTDMEDTTSSTAKVTDKRFDQAWFVGVSFNVSFVKAIFGS